MADEPKIPLVKKVSLTPFQQRIPAVNDDKTLSFALHGELNRMQNAIIGTTNFNAETLQLVVDALSAIGVIVKRVEDVESAQTAATKEQALINSYTDPTLVLSAMTETGGAAASITVVNHNRVYADAAKTTVAIVGKTFSGLPLNTVFYLYYDDATRAGGAVDIKYSQDNLDAAQTGIRHSLGSIQTGTATDTTPTPGGGVDPPGGRYKYRVEPDSEEP